MKFIITAHVDSSCTVNFVLEKALPTKKELRLEHHGNSYFYSHTEVTGDVTTYHFKSEGME